VDTLRGNLELFSLEAITGLLASTRKTGALRITSEDLNVRFFFVSGALVYATTRKHDGTVNDLRGRSTEIRDRRRDWSLSLPELLRHQITDVLVRVLRRSGGEFSFDEGVTTTALPSGRTLSYNAAEMIERARERLAEWRDIEGAIPDPSVRYRLAPHLPSDQMEITVEAKLWTVLAAVADGATASDLAARLGVFEFPAAKKLAELVREGLLVPAQPVVEHHGDTTDEVVVDEDETVVEPVEDVVRIVVEPVADAPASAGDELVRDSIEVVEAVWLPPPRSDEPPYGVETASHALAEWGGTADANGGTVDTGGSTAGHADGDPSPDPADAPPWPGGTRSVRDPLPDVPGLPPDVPFGPAGF
jgi:hypothetical protein